MKDDKFLISFVVPVYNRADCAVSCIKSIASQIGNDCELIVVDDGSNAQSIKIIQNTIDTILNHHNRNIRLIHQKNMGCSAARNTGISYASGQFITFIDGDDMLVENFVDFARDLIQNDSKYFADLYIFEIKNVDAKTGEGSKNKVLRNGIFETPGDFADAIIRHHQYLWYSQSNKLYRRNIINRHKIKFTECLSFGEDRLFNYDYLCHCRKRIVTNEKIMLYYLSYDYHTQSSNDFEQYWQTILMLHEKKMDCVFGLAHNASVEDKQQYERYDLVNEIKRAILWTKDHPEREQEIVSAINNIIFPKEPNCTTPIDYLVVLGSTKCAYRIERAFDISTNNNVKKFLLCGGNTCAYKGLTEAAFMSEFLKEKGISENKIIIENVSRNTFENVQYLLETILKNKAIGKRLNKEDSSANTGVNIGIVSAAFHLGRVKKYVKSELRRISANNPNIDISRIKFYYFPAYGKHTNPKNWYKVAKWQDIVLNNLVL